MLVLGLTSVIPGSRNTDVDIEEPGANGPNLPMAISRASELRDSERQRHRM